MRIDPQLTTLATLALVLQTASAGAEELFVSPAGDDANPGTREAPLGTLSAARDAVRALSVSGGHTIWIAEGEYELLGPFVLNEQDSGRPDAPNVWRAAEGAEVRLIGGRTLPAKAFTPLRDEAVVGRLSEEAVRKVHVADLGELGITDFGAHRQYGHALPVCPAPLELFFDDRAMTLACYPNEGAILIGEVIDKGSVPRNGDYSERGGTFEYTDERHERWAGRTDVWFQGTFGNGYADDKILVESIDPETRRVKLATPHMYGIGGGKPYLKYRALNILDELDAPGEWYLDRDHGRLYFWPPSSLEGASIKVSVLEDPILCLEGVSHVVVRDLIVEAGRGIGIYLERGRGNLVAGCTVRNVGTCGIMMGQGAQQTVPYITHDHYEGIPQSRRIGNLQGHIYKHTTWDRRAGVDHQILSCDVHGTGSGGIHLSGGSKRALTPGNNVVENCRVHDYNRRNRFLWSGVNIDGCGNRIAHCEIFDSDFQAIYAHGNDHVYEYNHIHHVTQDGNDISAWYLGRDPSDRGNVIRYNYFHHVGNRDRMNMGIYCDDSTTGVHVYGNVFHAMDTSAGVLYSNGGWDLVMENNIVVAPVGPTVVLSPQYYTWARRHVLPTFGPGGLFEKRLLEDVDITSPPYSKRYPELVDYMDPIKPGEEWEGMRSRRNVLRGNVIVGGSENPVHLRGPRHAVFDSIDNFRTDSDPGFVDMRNGDFNLRDDAEVFERLPGFEAIPFDEMGLYVDGFRREL